MSDDIDPDDDSDEIITCWCGARGRIDELFDSAVFSEPCGGTGFRECYCGGDFCVCHNHGTVACPGCDECVTDDDCEGYDSDDY